MFFRLSFPRPKFRAGSRSASPQETITPEDTSSLEPDEYLVSLNSEHWTERRNAASSLTRLKQLSTDQVSTLMFMMNHDEVPSVRATAAACLAHKGYAADYAIPVLTRLVHSDSAWFESIRALQNLGVVNKEAISALCKALSDPRKRRAAAVALGSFGPSAINALPALEGISRYCTAETREHVRASIGRIRGTYMPNLDLESRIRLRNEVTNLGVEPPQTHAPKSSSRRRVPSENART